MKQQTTKMTQRFRETIFLIGLAISAFLMIALLSYHPNDSAWSHMESSGVIHNAAGSVGAWCADFLLYLFGYSAYFLIAIWTYLTYVWMRQRLEYEWMDWLFRWSSIFLLVATTSSLLHLEQHWFSPEHFLVGGILGSWIQTHLQSVFNIQGSTLILMTVWLAGVTLLTGFSWLTLTEKIGYVTLLGLNQFFQLFRKKTNVPVVKKQSNVKKNKIEKVEPRIDEEPDLEEPPLMVTSKTTKKPIHIAATTKKMPIYSATHTNTLPALDLLDTIKPTTHHHYSHETLERMSRELEQRLLEFNIEAQVVAVYPGPVITRFELQLAPGVKVSKISGLAKDLARSLSVISVRIVEVIPCKSAIGLEVPNAHREKVSLRDVLSSNTYQQAQSPVSLALGKDISGHPVIVDLAKMPHLLVAGTTGSGKSVGVNVMLLSMLYKASPEQVRMILIDPKMLELSVYEGIPHLLTPVVTDMKEAANALRWCVGEMERRYKLMASLGVRNVTGFNLKVKTALENQQPIIDPLWKPTIDMNESAPELHPLPFIVVVIDEFADMMMVVGKKVEELIARIAQKARAAGIHLILATQRPSVDVITGLIKANIPTRIAFQVSSRIDSRTILDQSGAEQLLGQGDMLYLPPGTGVPVRVHGAFVDDHEVHAVVADWQSRGAPEYLDITSSSLSDAEDNANGITQNQWGEEGVDEFYDQAVRLVTETRSASISQVQRRLRIGFNRAARLIEQMEKEGIVGRVEHNGLREVLAPPPVEID